QLAPGALEQLGQVPPTLSRDRVSRSRGPLALALDGDRVDVPAFDESPQDGVDRAEFDREPEPQPVVVENLLDPVAVQRLLREQPEDEQARDDAASITKPLALSQGSRATGAAGGPG